MNDENEIWTLKDLREFFGLSAVTMDKVRATDGFPRSLTPEGMHPRYLKSTIVRWAEQTTQAA
jgi:predicted DNA-binding transcriptional regulator AlpA